MVVVGLDFVMAVPFGLALCYGFRNSVPSARRPVFSRSLCTLLALRLLVTPRRIPAKRMGPPLSTRGLKGRFDTTRDAPAGRALPDGSAVAPTATALARLRDRAVS